MTAKARGWRGKGEHGQQGGGTAHRLNGTGSVTLAQGAGGHQVVEDAFPWPPGQQMSVLK